ncbi:hypothetical protein BGZ72_002168, partial [Mortierella alpina]
VFPSIKYFPDTVLDVDLSSATKSVHVDFSTEAPRMDLTVGLTEAPDDPPTDLPSQDKAVEGLRVTSALAENLINDIDTCSPSTGSSIFPLGSPFEDKLSSKPILSFKQVVKLVSSRASESNGWVQQQEFISKMDHMVDSQEEMKQLLKTFHTKQEEMNQLQKQVLEHQEEMKQLQKAFDIKQEEMNQQALDHHEEIKQLQIQALGQLSVLQSRVQAVLTQTYELHEYPIPRLFVVLPEDPSRWYAADPFSNKFRLYFLCECGEHTKSIDSNTEIHFAKHEGYELARPTEFFQLYGSHVFTILKMLKFGISVAGVAVPAISHLVRADAIDQAATYLKILKDFEPMMDPVLDWMDNVSTNEGEPVDDFDKQMKNKEALAGADLRKLDTFLKAKDRDKVLGNLYRTVTDEGHVKWVCIDHYREHYQESTAKEFQRMLDSVGGSFDKSIGRVTVALRSRVLAEQFFSALGKARSVYELDIVFDWACSTSDLQLLEDALKLNKIFRFPEAPNMKIFHVVLPAEFFKRLSFQPKVASHQCKSSFELATGRIGANEVGRLAVMLKTNSILTTLDLHGNSIGSDGAQALSEALKTNSTLTALQLRGNKIGDDGAKALAETLKTNSAVATLDLQSNSFGDDGAKALAETLKTNSTVATLDLNSNSIGSDGAQALSEALKANSTLTTLQLRGNNIEDNGVKALAEALKTNSTLSTLDLRSNS